MSLEGGIVSRGSIQVPLFLFAALILSITGMERTYAAAIGAIIPDTTSLGTAVDTASLHSVRAGQPAPNFKLLNQAGHPVTLSDYTGKWVVLYFYPKDFSQGCTVEARNFQRDLPKYAAANAVILGVSVDSVGSHKDFCSKEGLNFKLLADTNAAVSAMYGSLHLWFGRKISARNTFLIDPDGTVARVFTGVQPGIHSAQVLAALAELEPVVP